MTRQTTSIPFYVEMSRIVELLAKQIYQSPLALLRENCQNAFDAILIRRSMGQNFTPRIDVSITPAQIEVCDNGVGMSKHELETNYWRAGASGKNTPEARAAGVVGTFGIGAMANFGVAEELRVETESARDETRTHCRAQRAALSAVENCIELNVMPSTGRPGTRVIAKAPADSPFNVQSGLRYLSECVRYLAVPVFANGQEISGDSFDAAFPRPTPAWQETIESAELLRGFGGQIEAVAAPTGELWICVKNIVNGSGSINGTMILRQGAHQIRTFRSRFALAAAAVSSSYRLGGIVDLPILEPTAGREALTTASLEFLQQAVTAVERQVSERFASSTLVNQNTSFMDWCNANRRIDLCQNLSVRVEPDAQEMSLGVLRGQSAARPILYYSGADSTMIATYATEETPLIVIARGQPRRRCEIEYLTQFCGATQVNDTPRVLSTIPESGWTGSQSAFALRVMSILEADYFVSARVQYGRISHNLPIMVVPSANPMQIVLDPNSGTIGTVLRAYENDYIVLSGLSKDFVRSVVFPKIAAYVPSSTRQGAEAFLKAIRRPREVFEYERADLGDLSEIWQDYLEGRLTLADAARQSTQVVRSTVQFVDRAGTRRASQVIPDVLANEQLLSGDGADEALDAQPAITRLSTECAAKLLIIPPDEPALKGYRCFIAVTDRIRTDHGAFFLQPHRTEVVWGGQKALWIFQHHSGQFGLYYEAQSNELLAGEPGGEAVPTCTIVLRDQTYIPVPAAIQDRFIPGEGARKRFEIRCELLYPDAGEAKAPSPPTET